jgi:uncharacterized protein YabE (DUF348 family)
MWKKRIIKMKMKKFLPLSILLFGGLIAGGLFFLWPKPDHFSGVSKEIFLSDNGLLFSFRDVKDRTITDFLVSHRLELQGNEYVFPAGDTVITPAMKIFITRSHEISVRADGDTKKYRVQAATVGEALGEAGVLLDEDDMVRPEREVFAERGLLITVTRVAIREETVERSVAFEKKVNEDDSLSWRKMSVTQKGEKGIDHLVYRVSTYDGKEVNRKLVRTERVKDPVTEIVTQGTYVKLGKSHTGGASWYAWTGTMAAANPWLPKGSYVKVTNLDNGKSVIVVINDRGPFVPGRIIDLDKVAFQKIASIGAGVITVKMEEIAN